MTAVTVALGTGLLAALLPMGTASADPGEGGATATTERISVTADGTQGNRTSYAPVISRDGRYVAFVSQATNLVPPYPVPPGGGQYWTYLRDLHTGTLERVSFNGLPADVHDFSAAGDLMVIKPSSGLYVRDLSTGDTQRVDLDLGEFTGGVAYDSRISGSGRYVVFTQSRPSWSTAAEGARVYVRDLLEGTTQWVSHPNTEAETYYAGKPVISDDGQRIAYTSTRRLPPGQGADKGHAHLLDRSTGERQLVDVSQDGSAPERTLGKLSLSADGSLALFNRSDGSPVTADDQNSNSFLREFATGTTRPIPAAEPRSCTSEGSISPDGRFALYRAGSTTDPSGLWPLLIRNLETGEVRTVTTAVDGSSSYGYSARVAITGDNRKVVFDSPAPDIVPGDTNATWDVFVRTLQPAS